MRARFMMAKLVASTAESLWRSLRRKYPKTASDRVVLHVSDTSRSAFRSRKVNVSMTTGTEVCSSAPDSCRMSQYSRARRCSGSRERARAIHARCRRKRPRLASSNFVVDAIVIDGCPLRFAVPECDRAPRLRLQHLLANGLAEPDPRRCAPTGLQPCAMQRVRAREGRFASFPCMSL